jgi:hypothetical protein
MFVLYNPVFIDYLRFNVTLLPKAAGRLQKHYPDAILIVLNSGALWNKGMNTKNAGGKLLWQQI